MIDLFWNSMLTTGVHHKMAAKDSASMFGGCRRWDLAAQQTKPCYQWLWGLSSWKLSRKEGLSVVSSQRQRENPLQHLLASRTQRWWHCAHPQWIGPSPCTPGGIPSLNLDTKFHILDVYPWSVACSLLKDFLLSSSRKNAIKGEDTVAWQLAGM